MQTKMDLSIPYIVTLSLLVTHQIDAAYWHEWEMFYLPGGIQFFDLFNLALLPVLLFGLRAVSADLRGGFHYSVLVSCLGLLTCAIHAGFYICGFTQFHLPVSIAIIVGCGLSGAWQLRATVMFRHLSNLRAGALRS